MTANNSPELSAVQKAEAEAARVVQRAAAPLDPLKDPAKVAEAEARRAAALARNAAGPNAYTPPAPAQAAPTPQAQTPVKPATVPKPAGFPAHGTAGQTNFNLGGTGTPAPHTPSGAGAAGAESAAAKGAGRAAGVAGKAASALRGAGHAIEGASQTLSFRIASNAARRLPGPLALGGVAIDAWNDGGEMIDSLKADDGQGAGKAAGRLGGKIVGTSAGLAGGVWLGAAAGTAIGGPIIGTAIGAVGGLVLGGAGAYFGRDYVGQLGEWIGSKVAGPNKGDVVAEGDALIKNMRAAVIAETKAGAAATPEQHKAVTEAEAAYTKFRKGAISGESDAQRTASVQQLHNLFVTTAKKEIAAVPVYQEATKSYKGLVTAAVMGGGMVSEEQQNGINAAFTAMFRARRQTAEGKAESPEATHAEVMKAGQAAVQEAERARLASGAAPAVQPGVNAPPRRQPAAGAPAPVAGGVPAPATAEAPPAPAPAGAPLALAPPPPPAPAPAAAPAKESNWGKMLSEIPILGPILGFFGVGGDPDKKSPLGNMLGMLGNPKEGLTGMGAMAAGLAVFAAVANMMDGGLMGMIVGLIAATIVVPMISAAIKSFGESPKPDGVRSPAVGGPQPARTQNVGHEQQIETGAPSMRTAALDQATQQANLQRTAALEVSTVSDNNVPAPHLAGVPAGSGGPGVGGGLKA